MGEVNRFALRSVAMVCGGVLLIVACGLPAGAALAQSVSSRIDQPTPGTVPPRTSTTKDAGGNAAGNDGVEPPSAIRSSTDVMKSGGDVQGGHPSGHADPAKHLPKSMR